MARTLHCTVVETPPMSDFLGSHAGGFEDLVPWADPYIAALMAKLRREQNGECENHAEDVEWDDLTAELPPPAGDDDGQDSEWQVDWSPRNWPRK